MGELFKTLKTYQKGGSPKLMIDWVTVPRKIRIKIVKEVLPADFIDKLEHLNLIDEIFNGDDVENEITYKKRLERYIERYPDFNEFVFESCHWKNVRYDVKFDKEQDTKELYKNDFQYLYYAIFGEIFSVQSYKIWSKKSQNHNKFLSDFVREIKFGKNKYKSIDIIENLTDIDGNIYKTVKIGNQIWMAENLRVSRYRNGDSIPLIEDIRDWLNSESGAYCNYNNNFENETKNGKLYNWYCVNDNRHIAPKGWHVPSYADWNILIDYMNNNIPETNDLKIVKSLAAKSEWIEDSKNGIIGNNILSNNNSGFNSFPSGFRNKNGLYNGIGEYAIWWSSTESSGYYVDCFEISNYDEEIQNVNYDKEIGMSIRCIKNDEEFEKIENLGLNNYNYNSNYDNSSMSRWTNYNDDLDMDQQNPDFWDQF